MSEMIMETACTVCGDSNLKSMIHFGKQPPANRFYFQNTQEEKNQVFYELALGYCEVCSTAQLTKRMPMKEIRPQFSWLLYNEPEGHLDDVSAELTMLKGVDKNSRLLGVTYKDQSTLNRLAKCGYHNQACFSEKDFGFHSPIFGLETIQDLLTQSDLIKQFVKKYGTADIVLMRHVIEHATNAARLIHSLRPLIANNGYLVMELPDSEKIFSGANHPFVWEEHISYFTEKTLFSLAKQVNAEIAWFKRYSYPYEDSLLVAFFFKSNVCKETIENTHKPDSFSKLQLFSDQFEIKKNAWIQKLQQLKNKNHTIAVFGAGHLAVKFINFFGLADYIDFVVDDNPNKVGMRMPGSNLEIIPSSQLDERNITFCISTLSPESELKVKEKLSSYFSRGGIFYPAFTIV